MVEIIAIIRPSKAAATKRKLCEIGHPAFTCVKVNGRGKLPVERVLADGSYDCFLFGKKKISSWSICRCDINDVKHRNPSYYQKYKDNMVQENMVLDIYNEIISVLNEFELGMELKKK